MSYSWNLWSKIHKPWSKISKNNSFKTGIRKLFRTYDNILIINFLKNIPNRCTLGGPEIRLGSIDLIPFPHLNEIIKAVLDVSGH
jgi:hypothetical protein